jgi:hypothetical protein
MTEDLKPTAFRIGKEGDWDHYTTSYCCMICGIVFRYHDEKLRDEIDEQPEHCPKCGCPNGEL